MGAMHNDAVFVQIVEELGWQGFYLAIQQCQAKLKALRKKYKEIVYRARSIGAETSRMSNATFHRILRITAKLMLS